MKSIRIFRPCQCVSGLCVDRTARAQIVLGVLRRSAAASVRKDHGLRAHVATLGPPAQHRPRGLHRHRRLQRRMADVPGCQIRTVLAGERTGRDSGGLVGINIFNRRVRRGKEEGRLGDWRTLKCSLSPSPCLPVSPSQIPSSTRPSTSLCPRRSVPFPCRPETRPACGSCHPSPGSQRRSS